MDLFKQYNKIDDKLLDLFRAAYLSITLFTRGIKPKYKLKDKTIVPANYTSDYESLFDLILSRHPNEDKQINEWRRAMLPVSKAQEPLLKTINQSIGVVLAGDNFKLNSSDERIIQYFKNFDKQIRKNFMRRIEDPNGLLAVIDLHEQSFTNSSPRPDIIYVPSKNIMHLTDERVIFKYQGYYHELTAQYYVRYEIEDNNQIPVFGYYHEIGSNPWVQLGGLELDHSEKESYYISDFAFFSSWGIDYLQQESDWKAILKNSAYPIPIMAKESCPICSGQKTIANDSCQGVDCGDCSGTGCYDNCDNCGGTGQLTYYPGRVINFDQSPSGSGNSIKAADLMHWAAPDMSAADNAMKVVEYEREGVEKSLHIRTVDQAQSGEAKALDMSFQENAIRRMSDDFYGRIAYILGIGIQWLLYNREVDWSLNKPVNFEIKTTYGLEEQYKRSKEIGASKIILDKAKTKILQSLYPNDKVLIKKEELLMYMDDLYHKNDTEIKDMELAATIDKSAWSLHIELPKKINEYVSEKGATYFLEQPIKDLANDILRQAE